MIAVLCLLLFSGRLTAASKSFGGGGYGGEAGGHKEPEVSAQPLLNPEVISPLHRHPTHEIDTVIPTPLLQTPQVMPSYRPPEASVYRPPEVDVVMPTPLETPQMMPKPATPSKSSSATPSTKASASTNNQGGYGSGTPSNKPAASASTNNQGGYGSGTPSNKPAASASTNNQGGYGSGTPSTPAYGSGLDPAGEPENGLNQKAIDDIVKEHNVFRAKEHVPPLTWNTTLAKFSQQYAETLKGECKMVHSTSPYGENLMLGTGAITWKTTVDEWSDERKSYHYGSNTCDDGKMCGHYTAVVWKNTTTLGCGRVKCNNGDTMIMCSYWPPGNYGGVKPY